MKSWNGHEAFSIKQRVTGKGRALCLGVAMLACLPGQALAATGGNYFGATAGATIFYEEAWGGPGGVGSSSSTPTPAPEWQDGSFGRLDSYTTVMADTAGGLVGATMEARVFGAAPLDLYYEQRSKIFDANNYGESAAIGAINARNGTMKLAASTTLPKYVWTSDASITAQFKDSLTFQDASGGKVISVTLRPEYFYDLTAHETSTASYRTEFAFGDLRYAFTGSHRNTWISSTDEFGNPFTYFGPESTYTTSVYLMKDGVSQDFSTGFIVEDWGDLVTVIPEIGTDSNYALTYFKNGGINFSYFMEDQEDTVDLHWLTSLDATLGGRIDSLHTTTFSFDLPASVTMSSGSGFAGSIMRQSAVPEPATWAMLIGGFFLAGLRIRQGGAHGPVGSDRRRTSPALG